MERNNIGGGKSKKLNSREQLLKARKRLKESGISIRRSFVIITCTVCGRECRIRTNDKSIYTEEVRKTYTCLLCKSRRRG